MNFQELCDIVILISAVTIAFTNIYKFFVNEPSRFFKRRKALETEKRKQEIINVSKEYFPKCIEEYDEERMDLLIELISAQVVEKLRPAFKKSDAADEEIKETLNKLQRSNVDVLRQNIVTIYYRYKEDKALPMYVRENLDELYSDYTENKGNHYVTKLYNRMKQWATLQMDEDEIQDRG